MKIPLFSLFFVLLRYTATRHWLLEVRSSAPSPQTMLTEMSRLSGGAKLTSEGSSMLSDQQATTTVG